MTAARTKPFVLVILLFALVACGQQKNSAVGDRPFQKRKFMPGWHIDIARAKPEAQPPRKSGSKMSNPRRLEIVADVGTMIETTISPEVTASLGYNPEAAPPILPREQTAPAGVLDLQLAPLIAPAARDTSNIMPRKRFNVLAIPSLLFVAAGITFAFTTNSALLVLAMLVVGLVLAGISLRRIRSKEQSGKGFALTALILGVLAALITTMVIIRTGF
jgi:hypothetical protein